MEFINWAEAMLLNKHLPFLVYFNEFYWIYFRKNERFHTCLDIQVLAKRVKLLLSATY